MRATRQHSGGEGESVPAACLRPMCIGGMTQACTRAMHHTAARAPSPPLAAARRIRVQAMDGALRAANGLACAFGAAGANFLLLTFAGTFLGPGDVARVVLGQRAAVGLLFVFAIAPEVPKSVAPPALISWLRLSRP